MDKDFRFIKKPWAFFFTFLIVILVVNPIVTGKSWTDESLDAMTKRLALWSRTARDVYPNLDSWIESAHPIIFMTDNPAERDLHPLILETSERYEVDVDLVKAIIMAESRFNPNAQSRSGAMGLMQIMPATAESLGVQNVLDPQENIDAGVRYFKTLLNYFNNDISLALAAYNSGPRNVLNYNGIPPFAETRSYIRKVLEYRALYSGIQEDYI